MFFDDVLTALMFDPSGMLRSGLRVCHFLGLALGLGTATIMDLLILRFFLDNVITDEMCDIFSFCTKVVIAGLLLLWMTGFGFLLYYYFFDPEGLTNEKVFAKILIVAILTINGVFIHKTILPLVAAQKGKSLLQDVLLRQRRVIVASAVISGVSWYGPLVIAGISQLNFTVPLAQILMIYLIVLAALLSLSQFVLSLYGKTPR